MSFIGKIKEIILGMSNSYQYYQQQNIQLKNEMNRQDTVISDIQSNSNKLRKKIHSDERYINELSNNENNIKRRNSLNNEIKNTYNKINDLELKSRDITNQVNLLKQDVEQKKEIVNVLKNNTNNQVGSIDALEKYNSQLINLSSNFKNEVSILFKKNRELQQQLTKKNRINQEYKRFCENCKISIILLVSNNEQEKVEKSINSIINQTIGFNNIELIILSNTSKNQEIFEILTKYSKKYPNIKIIEFDNKINENIYNKGIINTSTDYIMFLDSNHYYTKEACEILYTKIIAHKVDIVGGNYLNVDENIKCNFNDNDLEYETKFKSVTENIKLLEVGSILTKIYKKSFLRENNIIFYKYKTGSELIFNQETLFHAKGILFVDETIVEYELKNNSKNNQIHSQSTIDTLKSSLEIYVHSYKLFSKFCPEKDYLALNSINNWVIDELINSNLYYDEFKNLMMNAKYLFKLFLDNSSTIKYERLMNFYHYVVTNEYKEAYNEYEKLKI
ncbi:glycosyltransferase [Methanosphaera sp.]